MTPGDVREVKDAWPPHGRLFLVPVDEIPATEEYGGFWAVVEWAPMPGRYGDHMKCSCPEGRQILEDRIDGCAGVDDACQHEQAVLRYCHPLKTDEPLPVNPGLWT